MSLQCISPHLYIPHRWEHCSGIQRPCLHTQHTVPPLWPFQAATCAGSSCTRQAPQRTPPPSQHRSWPPRVLSSVHISPCASTIRLHCTEGSSSDWSSMVWKTCLAPWAGTACWDSWWRVRGLDPAGEDCLDLPEYLRDRSRRGIIKQLKHSMHKNELSEISTASRGLF